MWSHKTRGEFLGVNLEREIPIGEPDPLARYIEWGWNMVMVGLPLSL